MRKTPPRHPAPGDRLSDWHRTLINRRRFLLGAAGGSLAILFGLPPAVRAADDDGTWAILDLVQQHLFPSEPEAPGAREINALAYLRFVVRDPKVDSEERDFILQGAGWLDGIAREMHKAPFRDLDDNQRETVLRRVASSKAGENWLSLLIYYLMEALLTDPAYGGNPGGIGWKWLAHIPGFPRPTADKTYPRLLS